MATRDADAAGLDGPAAAARAPVDWLVPIDPAAHAEHMPSDWRTRPDATAVWEAIGASQPIRRWCLRTGYRTMRRGDRVWAYLSRRAELCAVGTVGELLDEGGAWFVLVDWDAARTADLLRAPLPRSDFGQVPMSVCRANRRTATILAARHAAGAARTDAGAATPDRRTATISPGTAGPVHGEVGSWQGAATPFAASPRRDRLGPSDPRSVT